MLAFVEVKTRRAGGAGSPFEAVDRRKQSGAPDRGRLADRGSDRPRADDLRFDVIGVTVDGAGRLVDSSTEGVF